jgi:hypothetical protein
MKEKEKKHRNSKMQLERNAINKGVMVRHKGVRFEQ